MKTPKNSLKHPIADLIKQLQSLPPGTTFEYHYDENDFYGGEVPDMELGTSYRLAVDICEGFSPSRYDEPLMRLFQKDLIEKQA